jgi:quinol-cytochrome oxidoreductase complex cytochrome b subunit
MSALVRLATRPLRRRAQSTWRWFDERLGLAELLHKGLYEAVPERGGWAYTLGSATLILIVLQVITGIFLMFTYVPSVEESWVSLRYLQTTDHFGNWIRGLHQFGAYVLIIVIGAHMVRTFVSASYKRPRELNWISGALLFLLVLGLAITGDMLPWDNAGYWTTTVVTNIPHYIPFIGDGIRAIWRGGSQVGPITLTRTFAIHVWALPALLLLLIGGHLYLLRRHGEFGSWVNYETTTGEPDREIGERIQEAEPPYPTRRISRRYSAPRKTVDFFPHQLAKDTVVSAVLVTLVFVMGFISGPFLDEKADPATLVYVPTPEWFYLPLDQILLLNPQTYLIFFGVFILVTAAVLAFIFLPFLDRSPERAPLRRPEVLVPGAFLVLTVVYLGLIGANRLFNL